MSAYVLAFPVLAFGVGAVLATFVAFAAFLQNVTRQWSDDNYMSTHVLGSATNLAGVLLFIGVSVLSILGSVITQFRNNWKIVLVVTITSVALAGVSNNAQTVFVNFDQFMTKVIMPVFNEILQPIINFVCLVGEVVAPWWNWVWEMIYLLPRATFTVLRQCTSVIDPRSVVRSVILFIQSIFTILATILSDFEADLTISEIYRTLVLVIDEFSPWVNCFCQEAAFAWNVLLFYLSQENFQKSGGPTAFLVILPPSHDLLNAILNFARSAVRFAATLVAEAIENPDDFDPFQCGTPDYACNITYIGDCTPYVDCIVNRAPHFNIGFDYVCDFVDHYFGQFDDIIWALVRLFVNANAEQVPRPFGIIAPIICFLVRWIQGVVDILFKLDLIWNPNIRYASKINVAKQFDELRRSATAVEVLFDTFNVQALHNLGCGLAEFYRFVIGAIQFVFEFFISFATFDLDFIANFLANYPYTSAVVDHLEVSIVCTENFLKAFNEEWASAFKWGLVLASRSFNVLVLTFSRFNLLFGSDPIDYFIWFSVHVIPEAFRAMDIAQRFTISLGNCVRTFDVFLVQFGMENNCLQHLNNTYPLPKNTAVIIGVETHSNLFCVTGDAIQTASQFIISLIQLPIGLLLSIVSIIASPTLSQFYVLLRGILDNLKFFVFKSIRNAIFVVCGYLSVIGSFFGCQDADGNFITYSNVPNVGTKLKAFYVAIFNIIGFLTDGTILTGEVLGLVIQCSTDPTSTPIFLQDATGCETAKVGNELIGPPPITTCGIQGLFADIINILCRYFYLFWDYPATWLPLIIVRLVDFILCLAQAGSADNTYFSGFFSFLQTIRCLLCDIVRIIVAIIRAFIYLFSDSGFTKFINTMTCFPPFNTLKVVFEALKACFENFYDWIQGNISFTSVLASRKSANNYFCAPTRPPCGITPGTPEPDLWNDMLYPWPPPIPADSPLLPCYIVNSYFFKRNNVGMLGKRSTTNDTTGSTMSGFTTLPIDGEILLVTEGWTWNMSNPAYNVTKPESPCHPEYRLFLATLNISDTVSPSYWLHKVYSKSLRQCIAVSEITNRLNSMLPFMRENPLPPNIHEPFVLFQYVINLLRDFGNAASYISHRVSVGGSGMAVWADFKKRNGITANFPLTLVSLWDQATSSADLFLSGVNNMGYVSDNAPLKKRSSAQNDDFSWDKYEKSVNQLLTRNNRTGLTVLEELRRKELNITVEKMLEIIEIEADPARWFNAEVDFEEERAFDHEKAKRVASNQQRSFGDLIDPNEFNVGFTTAMTIHASVGAWNTFNGLTNQLRDIHFGGNAWTRRVNANELKRSVVDHELSRRRKRGIDVNEEHGFSFDEVAEMQGRYNAHMISTHAVVLVNFTRSTFFKFGDIFMQGYNNTFAYRGNGSGARDVPFYTRRGIRNLINTVWSRFNREFVKSGSNSNIGSSIPSAPPLSQKEIDNVFWALQNAQTTRKRGAPVVPPLLKHIKGHDAIILYPPSEYEQAIKYAARDIDQQELVQKGTVVSTSDLIHITGNYYTIADERLEKYNEMTILEKRDDLSAHFEKRQVFTVVNTSAPSTYEFGGETFPLQGLCIGPSRTSSSLAPPFGNVPLPGFCFNCNLLLEIVNSVVLYLATAVNDTQEIFTRLDPSQALDPQIRRQTCNPCNVGPAENSSVLCCGDCDCHTGTCSGLALGRCNRDSTPCCEANSYESTSCGMYQEKCINSTCEISGVFCVAELGCFTSYSQVCVDAIPGRCGPKIEIDRPYPALFSSDYSVLEQLWNIFWFIPGRLFDITPTEASDAVSHFLFVWDENDIYSIEYWFLFTITCDPIASTHCDCGRLQGTGLPYAILYVFGSLIVFSVIALIYSIPSIVVTVLWAFSVVLVLSVAYVYSPWCLPLVPLCLFNDIRWYTFQWVRPCINWSFIFGETAVTTYCPLSVEQCFNITSREYIEAIGSSCPNGTVFLNSDERYFPNCAESPYNYDTPLKPLLAAIESVWPQFVSWLRFTNSPTLRYLRDAPGVLDGLEIGAFTADGNINPDHQACLIISGGSTILQLFFYTVIATLLGIIAYFLVRLFTALVVFAVDTTLIVAIPAASLNSAAASTLDRDVAKYQFRPTVENGRFKAIEKDINNARQELSMRKNGALRNARLKDNISKLNVSFLR